MPEFLKPVQLLDLSDFQLFNENAGGGNSGVNLLNFEDRVKMVD